MSPRRVELAFLGKAAAVATIVAAVFTVAAYFNIPEEKIETTAPSVSANVHESRTGPIVRKGNGQRPSVSTEISNDVREDDIKIRFVAARKIPGTSTRSDALRELARKASDLDYFHTAFAIASEIPGTSTRSATLSYSAKKAAKSGNIELTIQIAEKIPGTTTKSKTLAEISKM